MPYVNAVPYEVIAAPFDAYIGAVGAAFPEPDAVIDSLVWTLLGSSGNLNYDQVGVTVTHSQSINKWRSLGHPGPRKTFRTEEDLIIKLTIVDVTLAQYRRALNNNAITSVAGKKSIGLSRDLNVATFALLIRAVGGSPYGTGMNLQYEVPLAQEGSSPEVTWNRSDPAKLPLEFTALVDPDAADPTERFGRLVAETDLAS